MKIFVRRFTFSIFVGVLLSFNSNVLAGADFEGFRQLRSEHFVINYDVDVGRPYVIKIKNVAEKFYRIITQEFNLVREEFWIWENRANIFIAKDKSDYVDKFGCSSWSAACVSYSQKIIYTYASQKKFTPTFVHELTHIIFREYVRGGFFPLWLDEGIASYMEDKYAGSTYSARLHKMKDRVSKSEHIKFDELARVTVNFLDSQPIDYVNLFYLESFSIVDYIITKHKRHNFSTLLSYLRQGYGFEEALAKVFYYLPTVDKLEEEWTKFYQR